MSQSKSARTRMIAAVHVARKELRLDDDTYRGILLREGGRKSCSQMNVGELRAVLDYFRAQGWQPDRHPRATAPLKARPSRRPQLAKIAAMLAEAGRPWAYAHALAHKICHVDRVEWCRSDQLRNIIAALVYDQRRRQNREETR